MWCLYVIIDGETIDSCIYLAVWAEGKNIRTLEGLEEDGQINKNPGSVY